MCDLNRFGILRVVTGVEVPGTFEGVLGRSYEEDFLYGEREILKFKEEYAGRRRLRRQRLSMTAHR